MADAKVRIYDDVNGLIEQWVKEKLIPGAAVDIRVKGESMMAKAYGSYSDGKSERPIRLDTLFDAASLTKVSSTLPAILLLAAEGRLGLDDRLADHLPGFRHEGVTIRHLLTHTSGLPADMPRDVREANKSNLLVAVLAQDLKAAPGERAVYSDIGFILLGCLIERLSGEPLDAFVRERIHRPLGMSDAVFNPDAAARERCAATEKVDGAYIVGQVHDEKARYLGGACGSAGLFATARDLAAYAQAWLYPDRQHVLPAELMRVCLRDPVQGRGLGWEVLHDPDHRPSSCGKAWPVDSFGHTGFTGTSLWVDPVHELTVVFMTNVVHFGRDHKLRELRPVLHDAVLTSLLG